MDNSTLLAGLSEGVEDPGAAPMAHRCFSPEEARAALPDFAELIDLWLERRGAAAVPDWGDVDFADFRGWHASILPGRFESQEPDPTLRLAGQNFIDVTQHNPKGLRMSQIAPRLYELHFRDHFRRLREQGLIGLTTGQLFLRGRDHVALRVLELPFRESGSEVMRTVHALPKDA